MAYLPPPLPTYWSSLPCPVNHQSLSPPHWRGHGIGIGTVQYNTGAGVGVGVWARPRSSLFQTNHYPGYSRLTPKVVLVFLPHTPPGAVRGTIKLSSRPLRYPLSYTTLPLPYYLLTCLRSSFIKTFDPISPSSGPPPLTPPYIQPYIHPRTCNPDGLPILTFTQSSQPVASLEPDHPHSLRSPPISQPSAVH